MKFSPYLVILLLCGAAGHRYKRDLPINPNDIGEEFVNGLPSPIKDAFGPLDIGKLISQTAECVHHYLADNNYCDPDPDFSEDPYYYILKCSKGTGFDEFFEKMMKLEPTVDLPVGAPVFGGEGRCFGLSKKLLTKPIATQEAAVNAIKKGVVPDPIKDAIPDLGNSPS